MPPVVHRIRRQIWRVRAGSAPGAFQIRRTLREEWQGLFLGALGRACDEFAGTDEIIRIPRLEFRFRARSEDQIPELMAQAVREQLEEQVSAKDAGPPARDNRNIASNGRRPQMDDRGGPPTGGGQSRLGSGTTDRLPTTSGQPANDSQHRLEVLLHYLQTGSLPWEIMNGPESDPAAEFKMTIREQPARLFDYIAGRKLDAVFFFRLLQLISREAAVDLIEILARAWPAIWGPSLKELMNGLLEETPANLAPHRRLLLAAALLAESQRSNPSPPDFHSAAEATLPAEDLDAVRVLIAAIPRVASDSANPRLEGRVHSTATEEDNFPLAVHHAGLILLHPFLSRFLESTGVKESGGALSPKDLPRCAALLHWLATGSEKIYEYELGFIKLLLGLRPQDALCVSEGLVEAVDREEADGLLRQAIRYWSVLKNTSIAGLRSSFLTRPGLLAEDDSGWKLQIERQAFDVLLDRLPWSIGVVKLPWMAKPIITTW